MLPHPVGENIRAKADHTPHDVEQRELRDDLEHLARTAIAGALVPLDPLGLIECESLQWWGRQAGLIAQGVTDVL